MATLGTVALGAAAVVGFGFAHFGLAINPWNWIVLALLAVLVSGAVISVSILLRRPGVAGPGLVGGLLVMAAWLAFSQFTFGGLVSPIHSAGDWSNPALFIAVPMLVGVGSTWRSGSAVVGRRAARLAGVTAGLAMFFASSIAVVAIDGGPRDPGVGVAGGVSEAFFDVAMLFLFSLPLAMTAVGWVAATATVRFRQMALTGDQDSKSTTKAAGRTVGESQSRTVGMLLRAAVVVMLVMGVGFILLAR